MEWENKEMLIEYEDVFGSCSRWYLLWNFVVRRRGLSVKWSFSPPDTKSEVYIDYLEVYAKV